MGWKSIGRGLKKAGKGVGKVGLEIGKEGSKRVIDQATMGLLDEHGEQISGVIEKIDALADGVCSKAQADRIESKLDGITAQIAELRHLLKLQAHQIGGESDG